MADLIYRDVDGRPYSVRDGVSVWVDDRPPFVREPMLEYVGYWRRFAARLIDLILMTAVAFAADVVLVFAVAFLTRLSGGDVRVAVSGLSHQSTLTWVFSIAAAFTFDVLSQGIHGSSPGKMALGITVRSIDGTPCNFVQAAKRTLLFYIDALFFGLVGYASMRRTSLKQRFGDKWAGTVVVRRRSLDASQRRSSARFIAAAAAALGAYALLAAFSLLA